MQPKKTWILESWATWTCTARKNTLQERSRSLIMGDSCVHVPTHAQTCRHCRQKSTLLMTDDAYQGKMSVLSCTKPEPWNRTLRHQCDVSCCQWCFHWCRCLKLCSCGVVSMLPLPRRSLEVGHRWFHPNIPCPWVWYIFTYAHALTHTVTQSHRHTHTHTRPFAVPMIPNTHSIGGFGPLLRMFSDALFSFYSFLMMVRKHWYNSFTHTDKRQISTWTIENTTYN